MAKICNLSNIQHANGWLSYYVIEKSPFIQSSKTMPIFYMFYRNNNKAGLFMLMFYDTVNNFTVMSG